MRVRWWVVVGSILTAFFGACARFSVVGGMDIPETPFYRCTAVITAFLIPTKKEAPWTVILTGAQNKRGGLYFRPLTYFRLSHNFISKSLCNFCISSKRRLSSAKISACFSELASFHISSTIASGVRLL